ncbi:MAG: hypothetical protein JSR39_10095 [Verrucomicrobia bacterium]|nr:hypothetical protein [Verrucomicrobiota bacterium]
MIIAVYSKFNVDRLLKLGNLAFLIVIAAVVCIELGMLCFYPWQSSVDSEELKMPSAFAQAPFPYEAIGSGALMLNPHQTWGWVSHLAKELLVIAHNSRPDATGSEAQILLGLKTEEAPKQMTSGKTLFLEKNEATGAFVFSEGPQPLWIKPILLENGRVLIEAGKKLGQLDSAHGYEEKGQFVVPASASAARGKKYSTLAQEAFALLKNAKCWGQDLLIQQYGGGEFGKWREKFKIEFAQGPASYVIFVATGDYLMWKEGRWQEAPLSELSTQQPVALVRTVSPRSVELTVWDETGFYPASVELAIEHAGRLNQKADAALTQPRLRTASQVSCMLGKKRVVLRQGDWMLRTGTGWRNLRRKEEIESCLHHRIKGELFIFDSLEKEQGRWVLKGSLFDEMRTQVQHVSVPIEMENKTGKSRKKRKIPFAPQGALIG